MERGEETEEEQRSPEEGRRCYLTPQHAGHFCTEVFTRVWANVCMGACVDFGCPCVQVKL